jgi:hypothetical protein
MSTRLGFDATGTTDGRRRYHDRPPNARKICDLGAITSTPKERLLANLNTARLEFATLRCCELFTQSVFVVFCLAFVRTVERERVEEGSEYSRPD